MVVEEVQKHSVHTLVFRSLKRTHDMFLSDQGNPPPSDSASTKLRLACKVRDEYGMVLHKHVRARSNNSSDGGVAVIGSYGAPSELQHGDSAGATLIGGPHAYPSAPGVTLTAADGALQVRAADIHAAGAGMSAAESASSRAVVLAGGAQVAIVPRRAPTMPKPQWHPPWKLYRVISGHTGWVRCLAVEPANQWFATGSADRIIKIWDLGTGALKLSLTGHISTVRGVAVSARHPFLFSCGEDKQVKCWDLEQNKVIRHYHGHLSAVYALDIHPTIDILATASRDATCRIWDMRTKACVHTLTGHTNTVADVKCQSVEPQLITCGHDATVRLWDLAAGKSRVTLTNHKKSVRGITLHPTQYTFASASPDNIKQWKFPDGNFIQNLSGHNAIVNALAVNPEGVLVSGADNGTLYLWDWRTGYNFQRMQSAVQPGSLDSENGIFAMAFDQSGTRLLTAEADKTIKVYKEDENATEDTHPLNWKPGLLKGKKF